MKCPKDNTQLMVSSREGLVGHSCHTCYGIFLTGKMVKAFKLNFETQVLERAFSNDIVVDSDIKCPGCHRLLQVLNIEDIELDLCQNCHGVWFDKNEARRVIVKHGNQSYSGSMIGAVIEVLSGFSWL